jgi:hypothetical protein
MALDWFEKFPFWIDHADSLKKLENSDLLKCLNKSCQFAENETVFNANLPLNFYFLFSSSVDGLSCLQNNFWSWKKCKINSDDNREIFGLLKIIMQLKLLFKAQPQNVS